MGRYGINLKKMCDIMMDPSYSGNELRLLYIISDKYQYCMNNNEECRISVTMFEKWTKLTRKTILKAIKSLVGKGVITAETHYINGNNKSVYVFTSTLVEWWKNSTTIGGKWWKNSTTGSGKIPLYNNNTQYKNKNGVKSGLGCISDEQPPILPAEELFEI